MSDPGSSMSPTAVLVMATVILILLGGWLAAVFLAARQAPGREARREDGRAGLAAGPGADAHSHVSPAAHGADMTA